MIILCLSLTHKFLVLDKRYKEMVWNMGHKYIPPWGRIFCNVGYITDSQRGKDMEAHILNIILRQIAPNYKLSFS